MRKIDEKLCDAVTRGNLREIERLINFGADVNVSENGESRPPLQLAVEQGNLPAVILFVERGANVNQRSFVRSGFGGFSEIWSALDIAVDFSSFEISLYLMKKGAKFLPSTKLCKGRTSLVGAWYSHDQEKIAKFHQNEEGIREMVAMAIGEAGWEHHHGDFGHSEELHFAALLGNAYIFEALLKARGLHAGLNSCTVPLPRSGLGGNSNLLLTQRDLI